MLPSETLYQCHPSPFNYTNINGNFSPPTDQIQLAFSVCLVILFYCRANLLWHYNLLMWRTFVLSVRVLSDLTNLWSTEMCVTLLQNLFTLAFWDRRDAWGRKTEDLTQVPRQLRNYFYSSGKSHIPFSFKVTCQVWRVSSWTTAAGMSGHCAPDIVAPVTIMLYQQ